MLLLSSLLFIINLFFKDIRYLLLIFFFLLFVLKVKKYKKIPKFIYIFYFTLSLTKVFFNQEGEILLKLASLYITKDGLLIAGVNFVKLVNIVYLSVIVSRKVEIKKFKSSYTELLEIVIALVPEIFIVFKKRIRIKNAYRRILIKVYKKL